MKKTSLILLYSTLKSTVVQYSSWHSGTGIEWTGKKSYWLEKGGGGAEGPAALGGGGKLQFHSHLAFDRIHVHIFESLRLEGLYIGDLLYFISLCLSILIYKIQQ